MLVGDDLPFWTFVRVLNYRYSNGKCMIILFPVELNQNQGETIYTTKLYRVNLN